MLSLGSFLLPNPTNFLEIPVFPWLSLQSSLPSFLGLLLSDTLISSVCAAVRLANWT